ncbi:MAG: RNA polymerase sigma factor [Actinomycetota bacterium]|nr:RNA polymerase sigma factor [Actinomycetota bacterium]
MRLPPFERFYEAHRVDVLRRLIRLLGRDLAEDAFQETFLRALRAYPRLRDARNLRGWVLTIASNVAVDTARRIRPGAPLPELAVEDGDPPHAELRDLTDDLPPKERAAVVLRYGYDLSYADIAAAIGSNEVAARQAASSGVRRIRKRGRTQ